MSREILYLADRVYISPTAPPESWLVVRDGRVAATGAGAPLSVNRSVSFEGKVIFPGFVDGHVHLSWTGFAANGIDLSAARSRAELLVLARDLLLPGRMIGLGFDETRWDDQRLPTLEELDELAPTRPLVLPRLDTYMCVANSSAIRLARIGELRGVERDSTGRPSGVLRTEAAAEMHRWSLDSLPDKAVMDAQRGAAVIAAAHGITCVHEMIMPDKRGRRDGELLLRHETDLPVDALVYIADMDIDYVVGLGLPRIGGDLFLDGSIGARTAALQGRYADGDGDGVLTYRDETLLAFLYEAHLRGLQVALHVIGERAIEQALRGFESVYARLSDGEQRGFRARRHRLEHFEMATAEHMKRASALGLAPSVQPAFDAIWGRPKQMYEQRLGPDRAAGMNAFRGMAEHGLEIGGGSDSPMSPLDPPYGAWALENHHDPSQRWSRVEALLLFTEAAARLEGDEARKGRLAPGYDADFAVYDEDPISIEDVRALLPEHTFVRGNLAYSS